VIALVSMFESLIKQQNSLKTIEDQEVIQ